MPETIDLNAEPTETKPDTGQQQRRPYTRPQIVLTLVLETRAGTPLNFPNPYDPLNLDPDW